MNSLFILLLFILGAAIGSFLNVVVLRMRTGMTLGGRSMCMVCGKKLEWYELVPIVSFLIQHGRCRECHSRISEQYALVETSTAILFVLAGSILWDGSLTAVSIISAILVLVVISVLISIFVYDFLHKIIPDSFVITLVGIGFLQTIINIYSGDPAINLLYTLLNGIILFLPFYILWAVSKGKWIGLGDGKLAFAIGTILPLASGVSAIVLSFWIGAAVGLVYMYANKLKGKDVSHAIPFGPFMVLGTLIALFYPLDIFSLNIIIDYAKELL
jgi:prepilin signal peptidase PulO-like enzyme (type II secretory pathway)